MDWNKVEMFILVVAVFLSFLGAVSTWCSFQGYIEWKTTAFAYFGTTILFAQLYMIKCEMYESKKEG